MEALLTREPGQRALLLGNEAIVRGALEAGVAVATAYPGTPSSEIADTFYRLSQKTDLYFEYSTNEKVALEVAAGAAIAGLRAIVSMKHVGLNVAADPLNTLAYTGVRGGMIIVTADDPSMHSSQNEQDNRFYAKLSLLPMLEPSDPAEAQAMTRRGFELSEEVGTPVLLRTTTRVNHTRGVCTFEEMIPRKFDAHFEKNPFRWVPVPLVARRLRPIQLERVEKLAVIAESLPFNRLEDHPGELGVVASGVAYEYVKEVLQALGVADRVRVLKIGSIHPLPRAMVERFLAACRQVVVVEELEPYIETEIKVIAQEMGADVHIHGKLGANGLPRVPRMYELNPDRIRPALAGLVGVKVTEPPAIELPELPPRPPLFCAGCTHRNSYYAIKSIADPDTYFANDIGCYTLGLLPPMQTVDSFLCMGSSVTQAQGASIHNPQKIVAFIGDSTFFHSGLTGLANAVHNGHNLMLVILDNRTTAMTGHQPNPGTTCATEGASSLDLVRAVKGLGVEDVQVVDPNDLKQSIAVMQDAYGRTGVRVVITRHACPLFERRIDRSKALLPTYTVDHDRCKFCGTHDSHQPCQVPVKVDEEILRARTKLLNGNVPPDRMPEGQERKPKTAPCSWTCPANICVFGYLSLARAGHYREALALIRESVPLPRALGRVCHRPCEASCVRGDYDQPIAINAVKRFVAERESAEEHRAWVDSVKAAIQENGRRVAVVGAGPAGLTAAFELRRAGYAVDIFDREQVAGGMLSLCLPNYRMPRDLLRTEVNGILDLGITFQGGRALGQDVTARGLLEQGYEAVCLAVGAWRGLRMGVEGEELDGVEDALRFLRSVNVEGRTRVGQRVMVVGGGDAAMDACRTALRLGAGSVELVYRRSAEEMPADEEELREALEEGVKLTYLTVPTRFVAKDGRVAAAECIQNELGEPDASGRRRPVPVAGSGYTVEVDQVILAIGQEVEPGILENDVPLRRGPRGEVIIDEATGRTSDERVFAAGDLVTGPATVIQAMAQGKKAASGMDRLLRGEEAGPPVVLHTPAELDPCARYHPGDVQPGQRPEPARHPVAGRLDHFEPVSLGLTEAQVLEEAERCLSCGQCARCNNCIDNFGCPAIYTRNGKIFIDDVLCVGCGICAQLCPNDAIHPIEVAAAG